MLTALSVLLVCRHIELQQQQETEELCQLWNELRQKLQSVFHSSTTQPPAASCLHDSLHPLIERSDTIYMTP